MYDRIHRKYYRTRGCSGQDMRDSQQPLGMDVMCGVFYLLSAGLFLAAISLVAETAIPRDHRHITRFPKTQTQI